MTAVLAEAGDTAEDPIPVAIETRRGLLFAALGASGRPIFAINPTVVARYRERHSLVRAESDNVDARTLAETCESMPILVCGNPRACRRRPLRREQSATGSYRAS